VEVVRVPGGPRVVNLFAQVEPGVPRPGHVGDTALRRLHYFAAALHAFADAEPGARRVAMPHRIGCGLGGGKWVAYEAAVVAWARSRDVSVVFYRKRAA